MAKLETDLTRNEIEILIAKLKDGEHNKNDVSADDLCRLLDLDPEGPYHFVNLLRYKSEAQYREGHPLAVKTMSGLEAYNQYGMVAFQQVTMRGGRLMQSNKVKLSMGGDEWDSVATMEYQTIAAFFEMLADPAYQEALVHRDAGLEATEILITRPMIDRPLGLP